MVQRRKRSRRKWSLMILAFMLMSLFRGLHVESLFARAEEEESASVIQIIDVLLKVNGETVEEGTTLPDQEGLVELFFVWEIDDNAEIVVGDFLEILIPEGFFIANNLQGDLVTQVEPIGIFTLNRDTRILRLEITNPEAQDLLEIRGTVQIRTEFQLERVPVTNPVEFVFRIGEEAEKTFLLTFAPQGEVPPVAKRGKPTVPSIRRS